MERASMLKSGELFQADGANAEALLWGTSSKKPSLIASLPDTRALLFNTDAQKNPKSPKSERWTHSIFYIFILYLSIACVWKHGGSGVEGWLEDNSFHHVGPRDWTQGVRLGCKHLWACWAIPPALNSSVLESTVFPLPTHQFISAGLWACWCCWCLFVNLFSRMFLNDFYF